MFFLLLRVLVLFLILVMLFVILVDLIFLISPLTGAIYVPTKTHLVERMIKLAKIKKGQKAADIGSGDGRIVVALAKAGAEAHGFEINPILVWASRRVIQRHGLQKKAFIHWRNLWATDFSDFDVVTLYGLPSLMKRLENKLQKELKPGSVVVSHAFSFPTWKPIYHDEDLFMYRKK